MSAASSFLLAVGYVLGAFWELVSLPVVSGLHHRYYRAAA
jgi:hypothetical protein